MVDVTFKVEGLKELEAKLLKLAEEFEPKNAVSAMRPALKKAVTPAKDMVESLTPKDTGNLASTTKISIGKPTKDELSGPHVTKDTVIVARVGWQWGKKKGMKKQALAVEFGTSKMAGSATLRYTFDKTVDQMIIDFRKELGPAIEKMIAKLNKG